jgi:polyisoprenoid-binding protein YceI
VTALLGDLVAGTWTVDHAASSARFQARDVLRKQVVGTVPVLSAGVDVSPQGVPVRVWADLDLAGVDTGNTRRDRDLRGPRFFDVKQGGVLRFRATTARAEDSGRWQLAGELALRDARCSLSVEVEVVAESPHRTTVCATAALDRRAIGIDVPRLLVGRAVGIRVEAVLVAPGPGPRS